MAPVLGFSIHNFVNSVGADAGFASIIGLAVLVLLYFAHARETSSLRDELIASEERVAELEHQVARLARAAESGRVADAPAVAAATVPETAGAPSVRRVAPAPASVAARATAVVGAGGAGAGDEGLPAGDAAPHHWLPIAPAGVGAPALAAATKLIPTKPLVVGAPVATSSATNGGAPPVPASATAPVPAPPPVSRPPVVPPPAPPPATPAARPAPAPIPAPAPVAAPAAAGPASRSRGAVPPRPLPPPGGSATAGGYGVAEPPRRMNRVGRVIAFAVLGLAVAGAIVVLVAITSGGSSTSVAVHTTATTNVPAPAPAPAVHRKPFTPASVTVAVLNGTPLGGEAHTVSAKLTGAGYKAGYVGNAGDQTRTGTIVAYLTGHRTDAVHVARTLGLGSSVVQPVDLATRQIPCPGTAACANQVFVTVGRDLQTTH